MGFRDLSVVFRRSGLFLIILLLASCGDSSTNPGIEVPPADGPVDLADAWVVASPGSQDVDQAALERATVEALQLPRMRSLLVVRHGRLIWEQYFNGNHADSLNDVRSVTKSVVSTLAGIALTQGHLSSLDIEIRTYLTDELDGLEAAKGGITVRDLLTMSTGLDWPENSGTRDAYNRWILSGDPIGYVLEQPLNNPPGTEFNYNSGAIHLLGIVIERAVGMPLPLFAERELLGPLGIERVRWEDFGDGSVNGGAGLDLRPRDMARLGQLFLQRGASGDRQVVPESWVEGATGPAYEWRSVYGVVDRLSYGRLWWTSDGPPEAFFAWGFGGQFVYIVPALELVVVTTTEWRGVSADGGSTPLTQATLDIIVNGVVAAAR